MQNYNDRWIGNGYVNAIPPEELDEAIKKVEEGSKSEKYLSLLVEAGKRFRETDAVPFYYNEEDGERWCGRLKALYCPTCKKKVKYGANIKKPFTVRCERCKSNVNVTQAHLDSR